MKNIITICLLLTCAHAVEFEVEGTEFEVGGQIVADTAWIDDDGYSYHDSEIRRARLYLRGDINDDLSYEVEYSFTGNNDWKDVYLKYTGFSNWVVYAGNVKESFGMEQLTSSKYNTFMERALADFYWSRNMGISAQGYHKSDDNVVTYSLGGYGKSLDDMINNEKDRYGIVGRATYAKVTSKEEILHFGIATSYTSYDSENIKLSTNAGSELYDGSFIKTKVKNVDHSTRVGVECAVVSGPFSFQSEYILVSLSQKETSYNFNGWYGQLSYFLTGESRTYKAKKAGFSRIKVKKPIDKDGFGAVEVAFRITQTDLEDKDETGGEARDLTLGVNWYLKSNLRLMADYTYADMLKDPSKDAKIFQIRAQYDF